MKKRLVCIIMLAFAASCAIFIVHGVFQKGRIVALKKPCKVCITDRKKIQMPLHDASLKSYRFSSFELVESLEDEQKQMSLLFRGQIIWDGVTFPVHEPSPECINDFPSQGQTTYYLSYYSGGAHCCSTFLVSVVSEDMITFSEIDYGDYPSFESVRLDNSPDGGLIRASETAFAYYNMPHYGMCFAESPAPYRLLVYENGGWRPDRPGEFPGMYEKWLREEGLAEGMSEPLTPANAVSLAYYRYMLGVSMEAVQSELEERVVPDLRVDAAFLARDVYRVLTEFAPASNRVLDCNAGCPGR